eukprot:g2882.t1
MKRAWRQQNPGKAKRNHQWFIWLAFLTGFNWVAVQYCAAWVDDNTQQVLGSLGPLMVWLFSRSVLPRPPIMTKKESVGVMIVLIAIAYGLISNLVFSSNAGVGSGHASWYNAWYFIVLFILSAIAGAMEAVYQERVYRNPINLQPISTVFWYQLYGIIPYLLFIPMESVPQVSGSTSGHDFWWAFANQAAAFRCYFGIPFEDEVKHGDQMEGFVCARSGLTGGFLWTNVFIVCFALQFAFQAKLVKHTSAFWVAILGAIISPITAIVSSQEAIVGSEGYAPMPPSSWIVFILILVGVALRGSPPKKDEKAQQSLLKSFRDSNVVGLSGGYGTIPDHDMQVHNNA